MTMQEHLTLNHHPIMFYIMHTRFTSFNLLHREMSYIYQEKFQTFSNSFLVLRNIEIKLDVYSFKHLMIYKKVLFQFVKNDKSLENRYV